MLLNYECLAFYHQLIQSVLDGLVVSAADLENILGQIGSARSCHITFESECIDIGCGRHKSDRRKECRQIVQ